MQAVHVERFRMLFRGHPEAHGLYTPLPKGEKRVKTERVGPPDEAWGAHLSGKGPFLGIVPIIPESNTCYWGAIDLDDDDTDHVALEERVRNAGLPLVVCRSKSGGCHLYVFFLEPVPATLVMSRLKRWSLDLGLENPVGPDGSRPPLEIFPKQVRLKAGEVGNWINLPYWKAAKTNRYAIHEGKPLDLEGFLDLSEEKAQTEGTLLAAESRKVPDADDFFGDGPPCLQSLHEQGFPQGSRNLGLFNVGVYLKLRHPDEWEGLVEEYNRLRMQPPLPDDEVTSVVRSLGRTEYAFMCKDAPIAEFCRKGTCLKREYGIKRFETVEKERAMPPIGKLYRFETDPPFWVLEIGGKQVQLQTDDLLNMRRLRTCAMNAANVLVPQLRQDTWDKKVRGLMADMTRVEVPTEAGIFGQFRERVGEFLALRRKSESTEDLLQGKPFSENGRVYFRSKDLLDYLERKRFRDISGAPEVYAALRDLGVRHGQTEVRGVNIEVWSLPVPDNEQTEPFTPPQADEPIF